MIQSLIEVFRKPSAEVLAQRELEEAQRQLLTAEASAEYSKQMVAYHLSRIRRLSEMLGRNREGGAL